MEWHEAFKGVGPASVPPAVIEEEERDRPGLVRRFRHNLSKARSTLREHLRTVLFDAVGEELWEQVEEALIFADVGVEATVKIVEELERRTAEKGVETREGLLDELAAVVADMLRPAEAEAQLIDVSGTPSVMLVVGVNGTGKTTTIGKIAYRLERWARSR